MKEQTPRYDKHGFKMLSGILIRAAGISLLVLIVWSVWLLIGSEFACRYYSDWLGIPLKDFILLNLFGIMVFKVLATLFFLIPFAAVKWYGRLLHT